MQYKNLAICPPSPYEKYEKKNVGEYIKMCCVLLYDLRLTNFSCTTATRTAVKNTCNNNNDIYKQRKKVPYLPPLLYSHVHIAQKITNTWNSIYVVCVKRNRSYSFPLFFSLTHFHSATTHPIIFFCFFRVARKIFFFFSLSLWLCCCCWHNHNNNNFHNNTTI